MLSKKYAVFNGVPLPKKESFWDKIKETNQEAIHSMKNTIRVEEGLLPKPRVIAHKTFPNVEKFRSIVRSSRD